MIRLGTGILICGILVLFLPIASYQAAFAAFLVIGFGCAPIYPCIIHSTPSNFGAENSGAIIGIQMASAYIGTTFIRRFSVSLEIPSDFSSCRYICWCSWR